MTAPWEDPRVRRGLARQQAALRARTAAGATHVGWKVGFGAPDSLQLMAISAPLVGYLTDETVVAPEATIDTTGWARGVIEFEVAVSMGRDLEAGATEEEAAAAVAAIAPAIELADIDLTVDPGSVEDILAGNIFHAGVAFGPFDASRGGLDIDGMKATVRVDSRHHSRVTDLQAITGRYPWVVATVANTLASLGGRLRAGDIVITGSVIPPISVGEGTAFEFHLEPLTPISLDVV